MGESENWIKLGLLLPHDFCGFWGRAIQPGDCATQTQVIQVSYPESFRIQRGLWHVQCEPSHHPVPPSFSDHTHTEVEDGDLFWMEHLHLLYCYKML